MNIVAQICGILVMIIILYFYMSQKRLKLKTSQAFFIICIVVMLALIFDIASVAAIEKSDYIPVFWVHLICKIYLWTVTWESMAAFWYVCIDIFNSDELEIKWRRRTLLNATIAVVAVSCLPIYIHDSASGTYTYGASVLVTYIVSILHLMAAVAIANKFKDTMNENRRKGIIVWIAIWMLAALVQFLDNSILIVGFASMLGIIVLYLLLENPMTNMDRDTGLFNLNALFEYMRDIYGRKKNVSIVCVRYDNNRNSTFSFELENNIAAEVVKYIAAIPKAHTFRSSTSEFILVFDEVEDAHNAISRITERFEKPWGKDNMRMLLLEIYCVETTRCVKRPADVLSIFQYVKQNRAEFPCTDAVLIDDDVIDRIYDEKSIENEIIDALNEGRVQVFYQPIYNTRKGRFTTAEALVRIIGRDGEIIPPGRFIGIAEKRGLIIRLGERVFENTCKFIQKNDLKSLGLEYIEINLSVVQCAYENLASDFIEIMNRYNVDPKAIVLEITESASVIEKQILLKNMNELRKIGVRFALDDFGTGQSNLNYIVDMPIDIVKFDRGMTSAYFENGKGKPVMDAAMSMIQQLELEIVSEGIEKKEEFNKLYDLGIDYIQGYYFSKPKDSTAFLSFIQNENKN